MMISPRKGFGFICVPKAASTSIEAALEPHCPFVIAGMDGLKHMPYAQVEKHILPLFDRGPRQRPEFFAIIRDPVDRTRSWYTFRAREALADPTHAKHENYTGNITFDEFVEELVSADPPLRAKVRSQSDFVTAQDGSIGVKHLFRLEDVARKVPAFLKGFGIAGITIPTKNTSNAARATVDAGTADRIRRFYAEDQALYERIG